MLRSSDDDYIARHHQGWSTTSNDYHAHVSRIEKMPSIISDAPQYPNVHLIFKNKAVHEEEQVVVPPKKHAPEARKKVHFVEAEKTAECDRNGRGGNNVQEEIDTDANGFITQKHKNFELCKWRSFKT